MSSSAKGSTQNLPVTGCINPMPGKKGLSNCSGLECVCSAEPASNVKNAGGIKRRWGKEGESTAQ